MKKRIFLTAFVFVFLFLFLLALCTSGAEHVSLYINDVPWEEDAILPFLESEGKMLVPALAFEKLNNIRVSSSETLGSLLLSDGKRYLSFNLNFGTCIDEENNIKECRVFRYGGEFYLEPQTVCEKFELSFETDYAKNGYLAARLSDMNGTAEFSEILATYGDSTEKRLPYLYNPAGKTVAGSFVHPILIAPAPEDIADAILKLGENKVTFAISPSLAEQYASVILPIYVNGHTLAYYMDSTDTSASEFKAQMDSANKYLFSLVGLTSRIYVSSADYDSIAKIDGYFAKSCKHHLSVGDLRSDQAITTALYTLPNGGRFNFSLASERNARNNYSYFFSKLDLFTTLRSMPLRESSSTK